MVYEYELSINGIVHKTSSHQINESVMVAIMRDLSKISRDNSEIIFRVRKRKYDYNQETKTGKWVYV